MKTKRAYFRNLTIGLSALFVLTCASIIYSVLNASSVSENQYTGHTLGFAYLFLHLILLAIMIYLSLKAFLKGSQFIEIIMSTEQGEKNKKAVVRAIIFAIIFGLIGMYFILISLGVNIFLNFFPLGIKLAIANLSIFITTISLFLVFYQPLVKTEN